MNLWGGMILRAGITWGIIAILLAILGGALGPMLPEVASLSLGTYALLMAGVHYSARARSDMLQSALGGGLSGLVAALFLVLIQLINAINLPVPPGAPHDILTALITGLLAGIAGGLGFEVIDR